MPPSRRLSGIEERAAREQLDDDRERDTMIREFVLRCVLSGVFASILYLVSGAFWSRRYNRNVSRSVLKHDVGV